MTENFNEVKIEPTHPVTPDPSVNLEIKEIGRKDSEEKTKEFLKNLKKVVEIFKKNSSKE